VRGTIWTLIALAILATSVISCVAQDVGGGIEPAAESERTLTDDSAGLHFRGVIRPYRRIVLRSPIDARVLQVSAETGQAVTDGTVLVQLDTGSVEREVRLAEEQLKKIHAELKACELGLKQIDRTAEKLRDGRKEAEQRLEFASRAQTPPGFPGRVVEGNSEVMGSPMRDKAIDKGRKAIEDVDANRLRVRSSRSRLLSLREELQQGQHAAEAALGIAKKRLEEGKVTASVKGIVSKAFVTSSEKVKAGDELVEVIQTDRVRATLWLPNSVASEYDFDGFPWDARVRASNTETSWQPGIVQDTSPLPHPGTEQAMLEVEVDNRKGLLRAGMWVDAILETSNMAQASRKGSLQ